MRADSPARTPSAKLAEPGEGATQAGESATTASVSAVVKVRIGGADLKQRLFQRGVAPEQRAGGVLDDGSRASAVADEQAFSREICESVPLLNQLLMRGIEAGHSAGVC